MRAREFSVATILDENDPKKLKDMLVNLLALYLLTLAELRSSASKAREQE